jgi:hypothetical protein
LIRVFRRDPIRLPCPSAVVAERLLEVAGLWRDVGDDEADPDDASAEGLLIVEFTAPLLELPDTVGTPSTPL